MAQMGRGGMWEGGCRRGRGILERRVDGVAAWDDVEEDFVVVGEGAARQSAA